MDIKAGRERGSDLLLSRVSKYGVDEPAETMTVNTAICFPELPGAIQLVREAKVVIDNPEAHGFGRETGYQSSWIEGSIGNTRIIISQGTAAVSRVEMFSHNAVEAECRFAQQLIDALEEIRPPHVYTLQASRLSRAPGVGSSIINALISIGSIVHTEDKVYDLRTSDGQSELWKDIGFAQDERMAIIRRLKRGELKKYLGGHFLGRQPSIPGLALVDDRLTFVREEFPLVAAMLTAVANATNNRDLVDDLGALGVSSPTLRAVHGSEATVADAVIPGDQVKRILGTRTLFVPKAPDGGETSGASGSGISNRTEPIRYHAWLDLFEHGKFDFFLYNLGEQAGFGDLEVRYRTETFPGYFVLPYELEGPPPLPPYIFERIRRKYCGDPNPRYSRRGASNHSKRKAFDGVWCRDEGGEELYMRGGSETTYTVNRGGATGPVVATLDAAQVSAVVADASVEFIRNAVEAGALPADAGLGAGAEFDARSAHVGRLEREAVKLEERADRSLRRAADETDDRTAERMRVTARQDLNESTEKRAQAIQIQQLLARTIEVVESDEFSALNGDLPAVLAKLKCTPTSEPGMTKVQRYLAGPPELSGVGGPIELATRVRLTWSWRVPIEGVAGERVLGPIFGILDNALLRRDDLAPARTADLCRRLMEQGDSMERVAQFPSSRASVRNVFKGMVDELERRFPSLNHSAAVVRAAHPIPLARRAFWEHDQNADATVPEQYRPWARLLVEETGRELIPMLGDQQIANTTKRLQNTVDCVRDAGGIVRLRTIETRTITIPVRIGSVYHWWAESTRQPPVFEKAGSWAGEDGPSAIRLRVCENCNRPLTEVYSYPEIPGRLLCQCLVISVNGENISIPPDYWRGPRVLDVRRFQGARPRRTTCCRAVLEVVSRFMERGEPFRRVDVIREMTSQGTPYAASSISSELSALTIGGSSWGPKGSVDLEPCLKWHSPGRLAADMDRLARNLEILRGSGQTPPAPSETVRRRRRRSAMAGDGPDLALRHALHSRGLRYRIHFRPLPELDCQADIVFLGAKVAVFVAGCSSHGCPHHGRPERRTNGANSPNQDVASVDGDRDTDERLIAAGWIPIRIWEHEDTNAAADRVVAAVLGDSAGPLVLASPPEVKSAWNGRLL